MDATFTRQKILESAEHHYAERGFDGMSMRALTSSAGVNLAAVNYHFGSKKALLHEMFRERIAPMNAERIELLEAARQSSNGTPIPLEEIMDAFLIPVARRASGKDGPDIHFLRMVGRALAEDADFWEKLYLEQFKDLVDVFRGAIHETLPELSYKELKLRFHFCIGAMLGSLVKHPQLIRELHNAPEVADVMQVFSRLRDFLCAGFRGQSHSNLL